MAFKVVKAIRLNCAAILADLGNVVAGGSNQLNAPDYTMGNGGGSAGQIVRFSVNDSALALATPDTPSNAFNVVGMLLSDAASGLSATILKMGVDNTVYTAMNGGAKYLGTASLLVDAPPLSSAGSIRLNLGFATNSQTVDFRIGEMRIN